MNSFNYQIINILPFPFQDVCFTLFYRKRKIRRNMLTTNPLQGEVRCCQIWADGERERRIIWVGPNFYAVCKNFLLNYIQWHLSLFKSIYLFLLTSISSPAAWITKINKCISKTFIYSIFHTYWATALCCDWRLVSGGFLLATPYIPSNIAHGIVYNNIQSVYNRRSDNNGLVLVSQ